MLSTIQKGIKKRLQSERYFEKCYRQHANEKDAAHHQRFFKTQPGEYGEGDIFIGVRVPKIREVAKKFKDIDLLIVEELLRSEIHENRMMALIIMVNRFSLNSKNFQNQEDIFNLYIKNKDKINNWDKERI